MPNKKNKNNLMAARQDCVEKLIAQTVKDEDGMMKIVRQICAEYRIDCIDLKKSQLIDTYGKMVEEQRIKSSAEFENLVRKRRIRTASGVSVISVMTKPLSCPGQCTYCPSQQNMPKSYLDNQPAAMRGVMFDFDPYEQVRARLEMLERMGHDISKNEVIILGGTFSAHPVKYQELFIKRIFDAFNLYNNENGRVADNLEETKKMNETAICRMIGLTIETRPDYATYEECRWLRYLGVTRVELGVQSIYDDVLKKVKRGHDVAQTKLATKVLRQAGFKIVYHMMPGLPGTSQDRDVEMFRRLFHDSGFYPDHLKIYPTVVLENSELFNDWRAGKFQPYTESEVIEVLSRIKAEIPEWVRIVRVMRDIPEDSVIAGVKSSNLRQLIQLRGVKCGCIRCREPKQSVDKRQDTKIKSCVYDVDGGREVFISIVAEDENTIFGLVRLFLPKDFNEVGKSLPELLSCAIVRELHTYGQVTGVGKSDGKTQHKGYGKQLMAEAENKAQIKGFKKIAVIAGVGVRQYYAKIGYRLEGEYMVKDLI